MIVVLTLALLQDPGTPELRGAWLDSDTFTTPALRESILRKLRRAHLNTAFVTVPPLNGNYGTVDGAAFGAMVADLKAAGIAAHAWFPCYKRRGEGAPADFADAAERAAQRQWVLDMLAAYPQLDGVHFDYIRYSVWEANAAAKLQGVQETVRIAKQAIAPRPLTCAVFQAYAVTYRGWSPTWEGDVPPWYRDWYAANPDNHYRQKAVASGNPSHLYGPSHFSYQQDPTTFLKSGLADACASMQYTAVDAVWQQEVAIWKSFLGNDVDKLWMGLGWMAPVQWFEDSAFDAPALVRLVKHGRAQGIRGFVIFRLGQPGVDDGPLIDALSAEVFTQDVASPLGPPSPAPATSPAPSDGGGGGGGGGCSLGTSDGALPFPLVLVLSLVLSTCGRRV